MSYWALNVIFLAVVGCVVLIAALARRSPRWMAVAVTGILVVFFTAIFDNVMIAVGLFGYNPTNISGAFIGLAPLEDFSYAIAAVVLLPTLWHLLDKRKESRG